MKQLLIFFAMLPLAFASAQQNDYKKELNLLFEAFKSKDYTIIKPLLDSNVRIGTLPQGMNDVVIPQVLNQLARPVSYIVTNINKEKDGTRVSTEYSYENKDLKRAQSFLFNQAGKITDFDVLSGTKTMISTADQLEMSSNMPERFTVPFEIKNGIIFVKAVLNGEEKKFVLDSGSPTLILNSDEINNSDTSILHDAASGVGGKTNLGKYYIDSFNWNGIKLNKTDAITMSLEHLEKATKTKFYGLIGYSIFKDYQMIYDYDKKIIRFELTNEKGDIIGHKDEFQDSNPTTVKFNLKQHIPTFPININGKTYIMGLDCGASKNLLSAKYFTEVSANRNAEKERTAGLEGAGKGKAKVKSATIKESFVENIIYKNMNFVFQDESLDQLNSGYNLGINGLLGYPFLKMHKISVNYKKTEIKIYTN